MWSVLTCMTCKMFEHGVVVPILNRLTPYLIGAALGSGTTFQIMRLVQEKQEGALSYAYDTMSSLRGSAP